MTFKLATMAALAAALAVPAGAAADKPAGSDSRNAAQECKAERDATGRQAFAQKYGTNANKKNAFGKCVSQKAREEHAERHAARQSAQQDCRTEREQLGEDAFGQKYGTNKNKNNAFGKCVSQSATKNKAEADKQDAEQVATLKNAAQRCKSERDQMGQEPFAQKYGTNKNKNNAFGKCVSQAATKNKAEADKQDAEKLAKLKNAAQRCKAERDGMGQQPFAQKYGTNQNRSNAFGKCVSKTARS